MCGVKLTGRHGVVLWFSNRKARERPIKTLDFGRWATGSHYRFGLDTGV